LERGLKLKDCEERSREMSLCGLFWITFLFVILLCKDLKKEFLSLISYSRCRSGISNNRDIDTNYEFICISLASQTIESNYDASVITIVRLLPANAFESGFQDYPMERILLRARKSVSITFNSCHTCISFYIAIINNKYAYWY